MTIKLKNSNDIIENVLSRIETLKEHQQAIHSVCVTIRNLKHPRYEIDTGTLLETLRDLELDEWRNLFMWSLTVDDKTRDRIKAMGHQEFLSAGHSVAYLFNDGVMPGKWLVADEEEFREMARKAFAPIQSEE